VNEAFGIVSPNPIFKESAGGQAANSEAGEKTRVLKESRSSKQADSAALASGRHLPQQVPTPRSRVRSRRLLAPPLTALRICLSDTALQTQTIMHGIVNANANDCQYRIHSQGIGQRILFDYVEPPIDVMK
jgi:hypothetical protein